MSGGRSIRPGLGVRRRSPNTLAASWAVALGLGLSGLLATIPQAGHAPGPFASVLPDASAASGAGGRWAISALDAASRVPVSDSPLDRVAAGSTALALPATGRLSVEVTFRLSNSSELSRTLAAITTPGSPEYRQYLTSAQFDARFSPAAGMYAAAMRYFAQFGISNLTPLPDRVALSFEATPAVLGSLFGVGIAPFDHDGARYDAVEGVPTLPGPLAASVAEVSGLGTYSQLVLSTDLGRELGRSVSGPGGVAAPRSGAYLTPPSYEGAQLEYGPDLQVAYNETGDLSTYGYPTTEDVATILWSGAYEGQPGTPCADLTLGQDVGPWRWSDIETFYNETLPSGQPHSTLYGVPIAGAPKPGPSAGCDGTGAQVENTLDLEMVGSMAPGASIYNVYGPVASYTDLDSALADILSPPLSFSKPVRDGLSNVTVVSNSWGGTDMNDSSWYSSLVQAALRGVTVLASSGDSGDNTASSKYVGSTVESPSTAATNGAGMLAVGGTTVELDPSTLALTSEVTWNITAADTGDGGPAGSTGGLSDQFPEPSWQSTSEANDVIGGVHRGVPDIAAIANNTLVTITVGGIQYRATNASLLDAPFYFVWGTSIASPLVAGLLAEVDFALSSEGQPVLGFFDPGLYALASAAEEGHEPLAPFHDVTQGQNDLYAALVGYDLVTGWGSPDAGNLTRLLLGGFAVTFQEVGLPPSTAWTVELGGQPLTSTTDTVRFNETDGTYAYTVSTALAGYAPAVPSGLVTVDNGPIALPVTFFAVSSPLANRTSADAGEPVAFSTSAAGGVGPLTYRWSTSGVGLGCTPANLSSIDCVPVAPGSYTVDVNVTDAENVTSQTAGSVPFPVYALPATPLPTANRSSVDLGQSVAFGIVPGGGSGATVYTWHPSSTELGCTLGNGTGVDCQPLAPGSYTIAVSAADSNGGTNASPALPFTVHPEPVASPPVPTRDAADVGETVTFRANVSGGAGGGAYVWTASPSLGCASSTGASVACTPTARGSYTIGYAFVDADGVAATGSASLDYAVDDAPAVSVRTPSSADVGTVVMFSSTLTDPGAGGDGYAWSVSPSSGLGCPLPMGSLVLSCIPVTGGTYTVTITVTDANGGTNSSSRSLTVYPAPAVTAFTPSPSGVLAGAALTLTVTVSGGRPPLAFSYTGLPAGCAAADAPVIHCRPGAVGSYAVTVTVLDANGVSARAGATVQVEASFLGLPAEDGYALVVGLLGVGAAVGVALALRRRRRRAGALPAGAA